MEFEYYQDIEGNAYELKTDLEQLLVHKIFEQDGEIERLNNIINELFEYLKENSKQPELFESDRYYEDILDKLQDLKDSDKE